VTAPSSPPSRGARLAALFFIASGLLDVALTIFASDRPVGFDAVWAAAGRGLLSLLVALGLWNRLAFCRSLALVYCLGSTVSYLAALLLALTHQPLHFPPSIVLGSAFEVPSCVVLFGYLRSPAASSEFVNPLF
jgi:hypothetical protein